MAVTTSFRYGNAIVIGLLLLSLHHVSAGEISLNGHTFTLPDGFEIELVAATPLVNRPITADFDERGRLYVADSSGSNEKTDKQLIERTHRIVRLEDTNGDGRFDKTTVFADKMMFPEGTLWYDGSLYVSAPPSIWKLTDTDGDGVADQRSEWFEGKTLTGCANDLHGPYLGLDGQIYWCKGAFAEQTYPLPIRKNLAATPVSDEPRKLVTKAAHIFRRRPDGTGLVENVMTGGMDNPVDVAFMPNGERIFTTTFLQTPGGGLRDGLIHAVYGGVYGKVHDVTNYHPRTGDLMPPLVHMGPAAPCGLTRYESDIFGDDFRDNLFACQFNMHKVSRHVLQPEGATFKSSNSDFVVSSNLDFHPTDVLEDADGSLIICDTGGWYTLCCPTSQLSKPDILGGIYRVRKTGAERMDDARGVKLDWANESIRNLIMRLDDSRQTVAARAMAVLAKMGEKAIPALTEALKLSDDEDIRRNSVWTLTRIEHPQARAAVVTAVSDSDIKVRMAAMHSISLWRDSDALRPLVTALTDQSQMVRRIAAEALGRLENDTVIFDLLNAAASASTSRELEHSVIFALIEIGKPVDLSGLPRKNITPRVERMAIIANDQMSGGHVDPRQVVPWLTSSEPLLKETAVWLVGRHPDWGDALAGYLSERLAATELPAGDRTELVQQLIQFSSNAAIQNLLAEQVRSAAKKSSSNSSQIALEAMQGAKLKEIPAIWLEALTPVLQTEQPNVVPLAIAAVRALPIKAPSENLRSALLRIADHESFPAPVRVDALAAIPGGLSQPSPVQLRLLTSHLGEETSVSTRSAAVEALVKSKLDRNSLEILTGTIPQVGPLELNRLLGAFEHATDESVGLKLVAALKQSPVLTSLRVDSVKQRLAKFPPSVQSKAEELYAAINVEAGRQQEKLNGLVTSLANGDVRRGQLVFNSPKAGCSACHAIGYLGGNIGPDLSRIGKIRTERDLLESLVFPSVSFVRSYEPILILTNSGKQYNGLIRRETADEITLATGAKEEVRIARADIDEIRPSNVSIMPAGLDTQLTQQQIADLIAFLKAKQ